MKKIFTALLLVTAIIFTLAACKSDGTDTTTQATTEPTTQNVEDILKALENLDSNNPTSADGTPIAQAEPTDPETMPEGTQIKVDIDSDKEGIPKNSKFYKYFKDIAGTDEFTMKATCSSNMAGAGMNVPMTIVVSGKKTFVSMNMPISNAASMRTDFIFNGEENYMIFPDLKMYMSMGSEDLGIYQGSMVNLNFDGMKYVKTTKVKVNGVEYICEEYKIEDDTIKVYFTKDDKLDRMEMISGDSITVMRDISFSSKVDPSVFEIPKGYSDMSQMYAAQ